MTAGQPTAITTGSDGNLWFTESANPGAIGRMTTAGVLTEFTGGALTHDGDPTDIVAAGDGNLYFTENHGPGELGQITPAGVSRIHRDLTNPPLGITVGGDGNVWFTEATGNQIGRLSIGPAASTRAPVAIGATDATLAADIVPNAQATSYSFDSGLTTAYGSTTSAGSAGNGTSSTLSAAAIAGLTPSTTYHYRVTATNASGTTLRARPDVRHARAATDHADGRGERRLADDGDAQRSREPERRSDDVSLRYRRDERVWRILAGRRRDRRLRQRRSHGDGRGERASHPGRPTTTAWWRRTARASATARTRRSRPTSCFRRPPAPTILPGTKPDLPPVSRPLLGRTATIAAAAGSVSVKLPGTSAYIPLDRASTVPVGTTIDARTGTVRLTNVRDRSGKLQTATFWGGAFVVHQARTAQTTTVIALAAPACIKTREVASVAPKAPRALNLWAHDNHGRFVTRGHSAVATVRGTTWLTRETCTGTLVKVSRGVVSVRDLVRHRTVVVRAGHSYLARLR